MTPLSDHFTPWMCKVLKRELNIETVEEAKAIGETRLLKIRGLGKMFVQKLNNINTNYISKYSGDPQNIGCRCTRCLSLYRVDILIPDNLWETILELWDLDGHPLLCGECIIESLERRGFGAYRLVPVE
jgi:hypothetical protein